MASGETRIYTGETGTAAFDGYAGLLIGQRYTGTLEEGGTVRVSAEGAPPGTGITLKLDEWNSWFSK